MIPWRSQHLWVLKRRFSEGRKRYFEAVFIVVSLILGAWEYEGKLSLLIVEAYLKETSEEGGASISILNGEIERKKRSAMRKTSRTGSLDSIRDIWPWKGLTSCYSLALYVTVHPLASDLAYAGFRDRESIQETDLRDRNSKTRSNFRIFDRLCHSAPLSDGCHYPGSWKGLPRRDPLEFNSNMPNLKNSVGEKLRKFPRLIEMKRDSLDSFAYTHKFASWTLLASLFLCREWVWNREFFSRTTWRVASHNYLFPTMPLLAMYHYAESVTIENQVTVSPLGFLRYQSVSFSPLLKTIALSCT